MINNKIYDLATQAGLITFESIHDSMAVSPSIESVAKARKFAELIVRECANEIIDMADKYATFNGDHRRHIVHGAISEKLKEHFGVE